MVQDKLSRAGSNSVGPQGVRRCYGDYKISGSLTRQGAVYVGKVLLLERRSLVVVAETMSGPDGSYLFDHIPDGEYMLLARDGATLNDRPDFNATVIDYVHPEPMA